MSDALLRSRTGSVCELTLNRPASRNALDQELVAALLHATGELADDAGCHVVVLSGTAPVFCAGSDLRELAALQPADIVERERSYARLRDALRGLDAIVLAVVRGGAYGGGLFLAAYADMRLIEADAVLSAPEVPLGWLPSAGLEELAEIVGVQRTRELVLTGRRFDGRHALAIGFADRVADAFELDAEAEALARELAALPPAGVAGVKRWARERGALTGEGRDELQLSAFAAGLDSETARATLERFRVRD